MNSQVSFGWKIYFILFTILSIAVLANIFSAESIVYMYYHILSTFQGHRIILYYLNVANALLTVLSLIPLFLFVFQKNFGNVRIWQSLFILRLLSEPLGHHYEVAFLKSLAFSHLGLLGFSLFVSLGVILPSYTGCFFHAFKR